MYLAFDGGLALKNILLVIVGFDKNLKAGLKLLYILFKMANLPLSRLMFAKINQT